MVTFTAIAPQNDQFPFELVRPDLEKVEVAIRRQVREFDSAVEPYIAYICNTSGKRIRPALSILIGGALGGVGEDHRKIGVRGANGLEQCHTLVTRSGVRSKVHILQHQVKPAAR